MAVSPSPAPAVSGCLVCLQNGKRLLLTPNDVAQVLSAWTGVPLGKMTEDETLRVLRLADILSVVSSPLDSSRRLCMRLADGRPVSPCRPQCL